MKMNTKECRIKLVSTKGVTSGISIAEKKIVPTPSLLFPIKVQQRTASRLWLTFEDFETQKSHHICMVTLINLAYLNLN